MCLQPTSAEARVMTRSTTPRLRWLSARAQYRRRHLSSRMKASTSLSRSSSEKPASSETRSVAGQFPLGAIDVVRGPVDALVSEHFGRPGMTSGKSGIDRRTLVSSLAVLPVMSASWPATPAQAHTTSGGSPLASWNDGHAKQAILDFVRATTDQASAKFVPPEQRIATFDQDGTLWVEHPIYSQFVYCLDRVPAVVEKDPKLKNVEPFKTVLSGNREVIAKLPLHELEKILVATLTGMSVEDFEGQVKQWLTSAKHARWKRPYTELIYQPMLEVMQQLRANGFKTYIVTGGGQDFV